MSTHQREFIGIDDNRLLHVREVGRVCAELSESLFGWPDSKSREMFVLGFVHDIGYEYSSNQQNNDSESRSEEHTSELQSRGHLVCRLLLEKKNDNDHH